MATLTITLIMLLCMAAPAHASNNMIVEHYTIDNGLPNNIVYCTLKDKDGFLWLGTWHGLCSFDANEFFPYVTRPNRYSDIPPRKVVQMAEDDNMHIWIRNVDNRLFVLDKRRERYHDMYKELKKVSTTVQVIKIRRMYNGHVLVLMRDKSLFEAYVDNEGNRRLERIHNAAADLHPGTMRLRHSILGETGKYVYWVGMDLGIDAVPKQGRANVLRGMGRSNDATYFARHGDYLCVGTKTGMAYIYDMRRRRVRRYALDHALPVTSVCVADGKVYAANRNGFYSFAPAQGQAAKGTMVCKAAAGATGVFPDKAGDLWLYNSKNVLVRYNTVTGVQQSFTFSNDSLLADFKFCDAGDNGLFVLLRNGQVWRYNRITSLMQDVKHEGVFNNDSGELSFYDIEMDPDGQLWLSSTTNGVYKISFPKYSFDFIYANFFVHTGLDNNRRGIRTVYQAKNGDLWIGSRNNELLCIDMVTGQVKHKMVGTMGNVYHIMEDRQGNFWFSTKGEGLVKATPDPLAPQGLRLTRYRYDAANRYSLSSNRVYNTLQDSKGRIWVCTFGGGLNLMQTRGGRTVFINKNNEMKHYPQYDIYLKVRGIAEDGSGRLWVGTTDGLMSVDGNQLKPSAMRFETYRDATGGMGVADEDIFSMYKDSRGNIWMGIFGSGLNKLEEYDAKRHRPVLKSFGVAQQLGGNVVSSIVEDHNHNLWLCTENGLASIGKDATLIRSYDRFSGFPVVDIEDNTTVCLHDGRILIGCRQGLLQFDPALIVSVGSKSYPTFITGFKVLGRNLSDFDTPIYEGSVRYAKEIRLEHNQATFTISFATLKYNAHGQLNYAYILEGYDEQWRTNGTSRLASYANVPPGHYKFRVKALGYNSPERVLLVTVLPPWWATWWAYAIYVLLALAALYGSARLVLYMMRMRNEVYINNRLAELKIRFFTNISHELRTPLTLIKGPIAELRRGEKLSPEGGEYLELIDRNAKKMLRLVNQILDFRKVQNGKMKLHLSVVDVNSMMDMFRQEFRVMAEDRDIAFTFELPLEHVCLWADAEKMGVVINNLVSNAFKYTQQGGTITVSVSQQEPGGLCRIRVEDNGTGIPEKQLDRIFERFSQADNKMADDILRTGTGIGLSLSREYVTMMHGRIWAENVTGGGAAFVVEMPAGKDRFDGDEIEVYYDDTTTARATGQHTADDEAEPATDNGAVAESRQADGTGGQPAADMPTLLLVEDNMDLCRMMRLQLKQRYNVVVANDGTQGLERIYRYHPDIIVTDLMMPGIDGLQLLRKVRQDFAISHTPVIVLTAKNSEEDRMKATGSGANAFISKPFSSAYLVARIDQLLDEQRIFQRKMILQNNAESSANATQDEYEQHLVKKDLEFMRKIQEIVDKNLNANDFNIDLIAEQMGLSRSAFFKKLKSLSGFAPVDYVKEIRLSKAARLIETTDSSITEIAYSVGFRDAGYFGKCFRKKYGMTPKEYRSKG